MLKKNIKISGDKGYVMHQCNPFGTALDFILQRPNTDMSDRPTLNNPLWFCSVILKNLAVYGVCR